MLGFIACRVTSKILHTCDAERSWGNVNTIKYLKRYAISSDVSEKHIIVFTSNCIESDRIGKTESESNINELRPRHIWNEDDEVFDHQL